MAAAAAAAGSPPRQPPTVDYACGEWDGDVMDVECRSAFALAELRRPCSAPCLSSEWAQTEPQQRAAEGEADAEFRLWGDYALWYHSQLPRDPRLPAPVTSTDTALEIICAKRERFFSIAAADAAAAAASGSPQRVRMAAAAAAAAHSPRRANAAAPLPAAVAGPGGVAAAMAAAACVPPAAPATATRASAPAAAPRRHGSGVATPVPSDPPERHSAEGLTLELLSASAGSSLGARQPPDDRESACSSPQGLVGAAAAAAECPGAGAPTYQPQLAYPPQQQQQQQQAQPRVHRPLNGNAAPFIPAQARQHQVHVHVCNQPPAPPQGPPDPPPPRPQAVAIQAHGCWRINGPNGPRVLLVSAPAAGPALAAPPPGSCHAVPVMSPVSPVTPVSPPTQPQFAPPQQQRHAIPVQPQQHQLQPQQHQPQQFQRQPPQQQQQQPKLPQRPPLRVRRSQVMEHWRASTGAGWGLQDIQGHGLEFAVDHEGTRQMQWWIEHADPRELQPLWAELCPHAVDLAQDQQGHHALIKVVECGSDRMHEELVMALRGHIAELATHPCGSRVLQQLLAVLSEGPSETIVQELEPQLGMLVQDNHGNYVVQKMMECYPRAIPMMAAALAGRVVELATNGSGCRCIQRILERSENHQEIIPLLDDLLYNVEALVVDQFGNYVVQHLLLATNKAIPGTEHYTVAVARRLQGNFTQLSMHKYASNVVERLFQFSSPQLRNAILEEMMNIRSPDGVSGLVSATADQFGNYVIQKIFDLCPPPQKRMIVDHLRPHAQQLRRVPYAKHFVIRMERMGFFPSSSASSSPSYHSHSGGHSQQGSPSHPKGSRAPHRSTAPQHAPGPGPQGTALILQQVSERIQQPFDR
eukprot:TRINITY_DN2128_c0_g2_i1.p1 TRINITY_DN2128_c0_g2~~TRINITY_DN2128_c0_g2_i1.p1  ORF type:complete len:867 (+),score=260.90 TRINITY_DN2128_c0_g2_i1:169-2769(+)